jgi:hypothetical protein
VKNLQLLYTKISAALKPGGTAVWVSTTPVASNCSAPLPGKPFGSGHAPCYGVQDSCVRRYNSLAKQLLGAKSNVVIADLHSAVMGVCAGGGARPGAGFETCSLQHEHDVHPSGPGAVCDACNARLAQRRFGR